MYTVSQAHYQFLFLLLHCQRLKAAVHYTVGQICEETGAEMDMTFSRQVIATISEATFKQIGKYFSGCTNLQFC